MGFSHQEMEEKFEGIVDFAELWDFIDVPLRTYSSGMWARPRFCSCYRCAAGYPAHR